MQSEESELFCNVREQKQSEHEQQNYLLQLAEHEILPFLLQIWSQPHPQPGHVCTSGNRSFLGTDTKTDTAQLSQNKNLFSSLSCQPLLQPTPIPDQNLLFFFLLPSCRILILSEVFSLLSFLYHWVSTSSWEISQMKDALSYSFTSTSSSGFTILTSRAVNYKDKHIFGGFSTSEYGLLS